MIISSNRLKLQTWILSKLKNQDSTDRIQTDIQNCEKYNSKSKNFSQNNDESFEHTINAIASILSKTTLFTGGVELSGMGTGQSHLLLNWERFLLFFKIFYSICVVS